MVMAHELFSDIMGNDLCEKLLLNECKERAHNACTQLHLAVSEHVQTYNKIDPRILLRCWTVSLAEI